VHELGSENVVALGQGANDAGMLRKAAIGIVVASIEGLSIESLTSADVVVPDIIAAFELLEHPTRLVATLRR
jgi:soluble P-type ATPase